MSKRLTVVLCCFAAIVAETIVLVVLHPASAKDAGWRLRFKPGQVLRYTLQGSMTGRHSQTTTSTTIAETVRSVADDGTATLDFTMTEAFMLRGRNGLESHSGPTDAHSSLLVSPKGLTTVQDNTGNQSGIVQPNSEAFLPDFEPKPGDTWHLPSTVQGITAHARLTSIQVDPSGHHIAQIDSTGSGATGSNHKTVILKSTVKFDVDSGIIVSRQTFMQFGSPGDLAIDDRQDLVKASE